MAVAPSTQTCKLLLHLPVQYIATDKHHSRNYIQECYPNAKLSLLDACGISAASKEAISFGWMGLECLLGRPMIVPSIETQEPTICGKITPGRNYGDLLRKVADFHALRDAKAERVNGTSWLPAVRDLRVKGNQTRDKEREDLAWKN